MDDIAPNYSRIIKEPIDLSTIKKYLSQGRYRTIDDLDKAFTKMFDNCRTYNGMDSLLAQVMKPFQRPEYRSNPFLSTFAVFRCCFESMQLLFPIFSRFPHFPSVF
jgi:hypothetical protein